MLPTLPPLVGIGEGGEAGVCGSVLPPAAVHGSVGVREEKQVKRRFEAVPVPAGAVLFRPFFGSVFGLIWWFFVVGVVGDMSGDHRLGLGFHGDS